ncbi:MAG: hypothetical protein J6K13_09705 [Clostridia bacterium]|nr:hypothetical protein [Clostridia bacterium]
MMQNNMPQQPPKNDRWKTVGKMLLDLLLKNWPFKLLALFISLLMWAGLITQDPTLTREKIFNDVKISVSGADAIKRNGMIVLTNLDEVIGSAQLHVDVPQMQYNNATANIFNARIDLSRITETGVQDIKVLTSNSSTYGEVTAVTPATIQIEVDDYITRYRIPVNVHTAGEPPEGYYAGTPQPDPPMVAVSGPKTLVDKIVQAEAILDLGHLPSREGTVRTATAFYLLDEDGNRVESSLLSVTSESVLLDSVVVEQTMYSTKSLALSELGMITGEPADGYEIKSVTYTPEVITAAGRAINLNLLDTLYTSSSVDVTDKESSFQQQLRVRRPTELIYLSADTVTVEVEIGPVITQKSFTNQKVNVVNLARDLNVKLDTTNVDLTISGPQLWVQGLRTYHITMQCDVAGLGAGEYELPVQCLVQNDQGQNYSVELDHPTVKVTIEDR